MSNVLQSNLEQKDFWSSDAGEKWVRYQQEMDELFEPVMQMVLQNANLQKGEAVLDIGCGAGTSTTLAAQLVGNTGHCTGLDISETLLAKAAEVHAFDQIKWVLADAQTHPFIKNSYDVMISRFGVMFFEVSVAAFTNIKQSMKPGSRLVMAAWGPAQDNPWFMLPAKVAKAKLGQMPKTDRNLPGPFAFEDQNRVMAMLDQAGLSNVQITNHKTNLTATNGLKATAKLCCEIGPADNILRHFNGSAHDRSEIEKGIFDQFKPFETNEGLLIPASIHLITGTAN